MSDAERREKRKRPYKGLAIIAIGVFFVLVGLGTWQLHRLAWKEGLITERQTKMALPPLVISSPLTSKPLQFRRVEIRGRFLNKKKILIGPKSYRGSPGWHVVTPLELSSGSIVLVNRGWVPGLSKGVALKTTTPEFGDTRVVGITGWPRRLGYFAPENVPEKNQWFRIEPTTMAKKLGLKRVAAYWVTAVAPLKPIGFPIGGVGNQLPNNNHLSYALTWFFMAFGLLLLSIAYWWQGRR
ncbi:MAG: SURF1 family protein [Alphaproteobacteria bacterium]